MPEKTAAPWPLLVELNGRKYRRLMASETLGGGMWEYLSGGKWHRVRSVFLKDNLNEKVKEMEGKR